ncbi:MAG: hypothetical protein ACF8NJ_04965 [Phycisphaerales bacterium JB038]
MWAVPYEIEFDKPPMGYAAEAARKTSDKVMVMTTGFVSPDDGPTYTKLIHGFPSEVLSKLPLDARVEPWQVRDLLVRIREDCSCEVFLNEIDLRLQVRAKRPIRAGELVSLNDIADVASLGFGDVTIEDDEGVVFVFSLGWKRGFFFDFTPVAGSLATRRPYDLTQMLGECYSYLAFTDRLGITAGAWEELTRQGWFPFITLSTDTLRKLASYAEHHWPIEEILEDIHQETLARIPSLRERAQKWPLADHQEFVYRALDHFQSEDYLSACSILYPRMEGVMRSVHSSLATGRRPRSRDLVRSLLSMNAAGRGNASLLLPDRFGEFLNRVCFRDFNEDREIQTSRHSVAHGVAPADRMDCSAACVAVLTLDHIGYLAYEETEPRE